MRVLVLHGPNLNLLGERAGDERGRTIDDLNTLLRSKAVAHGVEIKIFQSNHEGALVDWLHAERRWADAVIVNAAGLAWTSHVLKDALLAIGKPAIEVQLAAASASAPRKSVVGDACKAQLSGTVDVYVRALERIVANDPAGKKPVARPEPVASARKTLGRKKGAKVAAAAARSSRKSIGRSHVDDGAAPAKGLTRAIVRQKIAERLAGTLSVAGLAGWARAQWVEMQRGAPAESGRREELEDALQTLLVSMVPPAQLSDDQLIELMTQLDP